MHVVANGISQSDTALGLGSYIERNEGNLCTHEELYVIKFVTILFLLAATHLKNSSVHALPREIWHGYMFLNS